MAEVVSLRQLRDLPSDALEDLIAKAPRAETLRDAASEVIRGIHGLPDVVECELQQLEVYIGRAGATSGHLRGRWLARGDQLDWARSLHAFAAVRAATTRLRKERWESGAQRIIGALTKNRALCCSNALTGDSGRWPETRESLIYVVARARRGKRGDSVNATRIHAAVAELIMEPQLPREVTVDTARLILTQEATEHHVIEPSGWKDQGQDEDGDQPRLCRQCGKYPARPGNYGFCGFHRRA